MIYARRASIGYCLTFATQGYSVLSDSAEMYRTNQKRLLNADILGG